MTPGDITMLLNETGGLRVQTTSPSLGGANVRVQGLRGRYTLLLSQGPGRREVPLTPRHTAGVVVTGESEAKGRAGLELYYTGRQALEDNPYRPVSRSYLIAGLLGMASWRRASLRESREPG